jgi:hypothetical protein
MLGLQYMDPVATPSPPASARPPSEASWDGIVDTYGRAILDWLRQSGLSTDEADALAGDLMQGLAQEYRQVERESNLRFRAWLNYAGHAAWCRLMETRVDDLGEQQSPTLTLLLSVEAHDEFLKMLDAECSHQRRREVLPRIPPLCDPADWEAFYLVVLEGAQPADIAGHLGRGELAVHAALYRVGKLLRQEMQVLEEKC